MMITDSQWKSITETFEEAFGSGCLKMLPTQNTAFLFTKESPDKPTAMIKSSFDNNPNLLHFRLSLFPGTAAYIGCLLQKHIDFLIAEHYEIDAAGRFLNESQAINYLKDGEYKRELKPKREFIMNESQEDRNLIQELRKKDLLN
ncbi:MAG: hypothetical protein QXL01_00075 [Thermoplasmatales archaeon]